MKFQIQSKNIEKHSTACLIAGVFTQGEYPPSTERLNVASQDYLKKIIQQGDISGKLGQVLLLQRIPGIQAERILLVGLGDKDKLNETLYQRALNSAIKWLKERNYTEVSFCLHDVTLANRDTAWLIRTAVLCYYDAYYQFDALKQKSTQTCKPADVCFYASTGRDKAAIEAAIAEGIAIGEGVRLAKDLGNTPGNICTPTYMADKATELAKQYSRKLKIKILDEKALQKLGMGAFLAVARGSDEPAKFIILEYKGADKQQKPIALVGKGITFDTGGISLKPAAAMDEMKFDMCGAASVLGALQAAAQLDLPINLIAAIACTENMPGGKATKPGDVVKTYSGKTVEVLNTDAEGRLILCDALSYIADKYAPEFMIDVATLTGAIIIALGAIPSGLFANQAKLAEAIKTAAEQSFDRVWQLPVWDEYQEYLESNFADLSNISGQGTPQAGSIIAASFLSQFVSGIPWAHLDIAATAWKSGKEKGATGRPVPLLVQFLLNQSRNIN